MRVYPRGFLGKISSSSHFRRIMIWYNRPKVMLCSHCSRRCRVDVGTPSFRENSAKV